MGEKNKVLSKKSISETKLVNIFKIILIVTTFTFYYSAIFNHFSMDDFYVNVSNPQIVKGIEGIPEIFSTLYADNNGMAFGYRPMVRTSFALEYQFTSNLDINPYISHFINILLYLLAVILLFKVLRRLLKGYNLWFPFLITMLFMAHPAHTEVVASLKNRDVLLNFTFSFYAIWQFVRWVDTNKAKHVIFGMISFIFALLSKETAIAQLAVFPLVLYFFTDIKLKRLGTFTLISILIVGGILMASAFFLPETTRSMSMWENPLIITDNFLLHLSTGSYILGFYLKLLFVPYPLLYYYGYNMIPVVGWGNPWVLVSVLVLVAMLVFAIAKIKNKNILSFAILYFFINMSMYANIVAPVPGIVGDRFVFFATLSFAIFIIWLLFTIFGIPLLKTKKRNSRIIWVTILIILIMAPYGYYVNIRNKQWKTQYSLYGADMPRLWNSVKANNLFAHELMKRVNHELSKPVNPYKFILGIIDKADKHYTRALELDSTHFSAWNNLGIIYSKIHGNQARLRVQSHVNFNKPEEAEKEKINAQRYFSKATYYFNQALKYNPEYGSAYFNLANTYELQQKYDSAIIYFQKAQEVDEGELVSMSRLANAYYLNKQPLEAVQQNEKIIKDYPNSDMPYINLGNYAINANDTIAAVEYFSKAFELGSKPAIGKLLSSYYAFKGDKSKYDYYMKKTQETKPLGQNKKQ
ncbi:MAG: tetratricopeptide repeat protein [Bacteroidetes bacterium]|nr:tetratricopeptide repeat protein [Bacteroidota bacterium]